MYLISLLNEKKTHQNPQPPKPQLTTTKNQQISLLNCLLTGIVKLLPTSPDLSPSEYKPAFNEPTLTKIPVLSGPLLSSRAPITARNVLCSTSGGAGKSLQSARSCTDRF